MAACLHVDSRLLSDNLSLAIWPCVFSGPVPAWEPNTVCFRYTLCILFILCFCSIQLTTVQVFNILKCIFFPCIWKVIELCTANPCQSNLDYLVRFFLDICWHIWIWDSYCVETLEETRDDYWSLLSLLNDCLVGPWEKQNNSWCFALNLLIPYSHYLSILKWHLKTKRNISLHARCKISGASPASFTLSVLPLQVRGG